LTHETIIVDSGSTDRTLEIARRFECEIIRIAKKDFTFGRSLNYGCAKARGDVLIIISGHCVPSSDDWLEILTLPVRNGTSAYSYGRQLGRDSTKFSEEQVFSKYFPSEDRVPQDGFFCNNANAALSRHAWTKYRFDETLTGLEDLKLAKGIVADGGSVSYVSSAAVYHIHHETWHQIRIRYEREALALREIMPEIHVNLFDFVRYFTSGVTHDFLIAFNQKMLMGNIFEILAFRWMQFWGTYRGNREHRELSARQREEFFYPKPSRRTLSDESSSRASSLESP
jgi:glycosyltransferase involved in cell wall biosynthesis